VSHRLHQNVTAVTQTEDWWKTGMCIRQGLPNFTLQQNSKLRVCTIHKSVLYSKLYGMFCLHWQLQTFHC